MLCTFLAASALTAKAAATPRFVLDTVVTDSDAPVGTATLGRVHPITGDGSPTTVRIGAFEYTATATLQRNGTVQLMETVIHHYDNGRDRIFSPYERRVFSSDTAALALGGVFFSTTTTTLK